MSQGRGAGLMRSKAYARGSVEGSGEEEPEPNGGENSTEQTLKDLASMLQTHIAALDARGARRSQKAAEQERWFEALRHQFSCMQQDIESMMDTSSTPRWRSRRARSFGWWTGGARWSAVSCPAVVYSVVFPLGRSATIA
ncbi:hypothetical protein AALO_G00255170 [Alosa alosa]|uniref:Uncharacterized protein n=1 Tax=Alosa alosa TaxID=278164 RepID=A0AAV6FTG9_9TELE|nr:hypothetical protein AALO_G00255170 [Alosa alosa]